MKNRQIELICIGIIIFFWNFILTFAKDSPPEERQTFVVRYKNGDQTIPVTVVLDYKKQTEYVINMNNRSPEKSVTLYDFKQRTIAYKDLTNHECFLGQLTHETLTEESEALQDVKNPVETQPTKVLSLDPHRQALTPTQIRNIAGQKTAIFCRKMTTWMLKPNNNHNIQKRNLKVEELSNGNHSSHTLHHSHFGHETRRQFQRKIKEKPRPLLQPENEELSSANPSPMHLYFREQDHVLHYKSENEFTSDKANSKNYGSHKDSQHLDILNDKKTANLRQNNRKLRNDFIFRKDTTQYAVSRDQVLRKNHNPRRIRNFNFDQNILPLSNFKTLSTPLDTKNYIRSDKKHLKRNFTDDSDLISRMERETTPEDDVPNYYFANSNDTARYSKLEKDDFEYDSPDFHREIESKVLPLDYNQNYYPEVKNETESHLENFYSSVKIRNDVGKDLHRKLSDRFFTTENPEFSVNVLEIPKITPKLESHYQQVPKFTRNFAGRYPSKTYNFETESSNSERNHRTVIETYPKLNNLPKFQNLNLTIEEDSFRERNSNDYATTTVPVATETTSAPSVQTQTNNFKELNHHFESSLNKPFHTENLHASNMDNSKSEDFMFTDELHKNQRSDILAENFENDINLYTTTNVNILETTHQPLTTSTTANNESYHRHIRFENVLRLFKPDEIIIDVENIPTQQPPELSRQFHRQRTLVEPAIRRSPLRTTKLQFKSMHTETVQPIRSTQFYQWTTSPTVSSFLKVNRTTVRSGSNSEQTLGLTWRSSPVKTQEKSRVMNNYTNRHVSKVYSSILQNKLYPVLNNSSMLNVLPRETISGRNHAQNFNLERKTFNPYPFNPHQNAIISQSRQRSALPPGVSMHPRHPQAPYADMVHSNVIQPLPQEFKYRNFPKQHRQRHHRRKDRLLNSCCKDAEKSPDALSCCRRQGCCSSHRQNNHQLRSSCCQSMNKVGGKRTTPANLSRIPTRNNQPSREISEIHSESENRCQKEKMCRTLYQSTQQIIVCRNADIKGC